MKGIPESAIPCHGNPEVCASQIHQERKKENIHHPDINSHHIMLPDHTTPQNAMK